MYYRSADFSTFPGDRGMTTRRAALVTVANSGIGKTIAARRPLPALSRSITNSTRPPPILAKELQAKERAIAVYADVSSSKM
jgi:hypothetical protein